MRKKEAELTLTSVPFLRSHKGNCLNIVSSFDSFSYFELVICCYHETRKKEKKTRFLLQQLLLHLRLYCHYYYDYDYSYYSLLVALLPVHCQLCPDS